jgi:hypothetical protein
MSGTKGIVLREWSGRRRTLRVFDPSIREICGFSAWPSDDKFLTVSHLINSTQGERKEAK